jgi:hypothetical protein
MGVDFIRRKGTYQLYLPNFKFHFFKLIVYFNLIRLVEVFDFGRCGAAIYKKSGFKK